MIYLIDRLHLISDRPLGNSAELKMRRPILNKNQIGGINLASYNPSAEQEVIFGIDCNGKH
jgi:hypothetical protein